jgi:hypothetical protein
MEFKTKSALAECANDQTMAEIATYHNGLPGVKPVKKFESRDVAVTRIWAVVDGQGPATGANTAADKPKVARKPKVSRKSATSGRKPGKTAAKKAASAGLKVRDEAVKLLSRAGGATLPEMMKAFKWQAHSVRGFMSILASKHGFKVDSSSVEGVRTYRIK